MVYVSGRAGVRKWLLTLACALAFPSSHLLEASSVHAGPLPGMSSVAWLLLPKFYPSVILMPPPPCSQF